MANPKEEEFECIEAVEELLECEPDETIGIMLTTRDMVSHWENLLLKAGIDCERLVSKSRYDELEYKVLSPGVKLVTYHSGKGLEFDNVLLPRVDTDKLPMGIRKDAPEDEKEDAIDKARNILYVGMTRARLRLEIFCCKDSVRQPASMLFELNPKYYVNDGLLDE